MKLSKLNPSDSKKAGRPRSQRFAVQNAGTKSFRFSPQLRFALRLLAKQRGTDETSAVEDAVLKSIERLGLSRDWLSLYDDDEVARELKLFMLSEYNVSDEDARIRSFVFSHARFFYQDERRQHPRLDSARVLWPNLERYIRAFHERMHEDYNVASKMMAADLKKAGVKAPAIEAEK